MSSNLRRGALFAIAASVAFAVSSAFIKAVSVQASNEMIVFVRTTTALLLLLPWAFSQGLVGLRTQRLGGHLWRSAFGLTSMYCFFYALGKLPLAEAMLLTYSTPLFVPFIAWSGLGEKPPWIAFPAAAVGLAGVAFIVKPGGGGLVSYAGLIGLMAGIFGAFAMVSIRQISDTEPATRIVFYFSVLATLCSLPPVLLNWQTPAAVTLMLLIAVGVSATIGQLLITRAYAAAPAATIGSFMYFVVLFSAALGWWLWDERLDRWSLLGATLVIATCVMVSWKRREPNLEE